MFTLDMLIYKIKLENEAITFDKIQIQMRPSFNNLKSNRISPRHSCPVNFVGLSRDYEINWAKINSFAKSSSEKTDNLIKSKLENHNWNKVLDLFNQ